LPQIQGAEVTAVLPDTLDVTVTERTPVAVWRNGDGDYLVDREGVVLMKSVDTNEAGTGCPPRVCAAPLTVVAQADSGSVAPGSRVDANALSASARLAALLPATGVEPLAFEWSRERGLEVPTRQGVRVRFDGAGDLEWQLTALRTVSQHLAQTRRSAEVIDVRFGDRPVFR
jgi:hypothetical protein